MSKTELSTEFIQQMHMEFYSAITAAMSMQNVSQIACRIATENCLRRMLIVVYGLTVEQANEIIFLRTIW